MGDDDEVDFLLFLFSFSFSFSAADCVANANNISLTKKFRPSIFTGIVIRVFASHLWIPGSRTMVECGVARAMAFLREVQGLVAEQSPSSSTSSKSPSK